MIGDWGGDYGRVAKPWLIRPDWVGLEFFYGDILWAPIFR